MVIQRRPKRTQDQSPGLCVGLCRARDGLIERSIFSALILWFLFMVRLSFTLLVTRYAILRSCPCLPGISHFDYSNDHCLYSHAQYHYLLALPWTIEKSYALMITFVQYEFHSINRKFYHSHLSCVSCRLVKPVQFHI